MLGRLSSLHEDLAEVVRALDPACMNAADAARLVERFAAMERLCAAGKTLAARRVLGSAAWARDGDRSPADWLARTSGVGLGEAHATLDTARRLEELPTTEEALRAGELSRAQAAEITAAATLDPEAEADLLRAADRHGFKGLKERCARVKAAVRADEVDRYARIRQERSLRTWEDCDGAHLHMQATPDAVATVLAGIKPYERQLFETARSRGEHARPGAYAADALVALAQASLDGQGARRSGPRATIHVRVDHSAFVRGRTEAGEVCEIPGVGPIPVATAHALASDAILYAVVTKGVDVTAVASVGRTIPTALRVALQEVYPECAQRGCDVRQGLENDHIVPWAPPDNGPTAMHNLVRWCRYHHFLKTYRGYRPVRGPDGQWDLIPPDRPPPQRPDPFVSDEELALAV